MKLNTSFPRISSKTFTFIGLLMSNALFSQSLPDPCGFGSVMEMMMLQNPAYRNAIEDFDISYTENDDCENNTPYLIPVVFHVIHDNGPENISEAQIDNALAQLNMQFSGGQGGYNTLIQFSRATIDPTGNCTNGVIRIQTNNPDVNKNSYADDVALKNLSRWPPDRYVNIWIVRCILPNSECPNGAVTTGYAYLPLGVSPEVDGIVILHKFLGTTGTAIGNTHNTLTHEMGHYLGLLHVWGWDNAADLCTANCVFPASGDNISDTNPCKSAQLTQDCSLVPTDCETCSGFPLSQYTYPKDNYMSYAAPCQNRFTKCQSYRMKEIAEFSRAALLLGDNLSCPESGIYFGSDIVIETNTNWTIANLPNGGNVNITGTLTIQASASNPNTPVTLNIGSGVVVNFCENGKVIIKPNAILDLSGTLTNSCETPWKGVEVWGDNSKSQYIQSGKRWQGRLVGRNGAVIENAQTAVKLYGPTLAFAGGQISCTGTTFRNNIIGVDFADYLNFWPFPYPTGQLGQPRNYLGAFSRCAFMTDNGYPHTQPFNSFIFMSGVNGVNIAGTSFVNQRTIDGNAIDDWGYGIQSVDAGFAVTGSPDGIFFPPPSYTFSGFSGLGYGIQAQTSTSNRPYTVTQTNFDRCFIGIRNWSVDGATILFNNFNLGDLPSTEPTEDQFGVIFESDATGFTCEENEFTQVTGPNGITTIGSFCLNTGDQHKEIRRNTYTGLHIGNLANDQNAYIDNPTDPFDDNIIRGLYYNCNRNFNVVNGSGIDFSVPNGLVREEQGLEIPQPNGQFDYGAAGNRFSYTGVDFSNSGTGITYYFDPLSANHEPMVTQGGVLEEDAQGNGCAQSFCEPPCKTEGELNGIKADYYAKKASLVALNATVGTSPTEQQKVALAYYQRTMDKNAYMVALHIMYDTVQYHTDSLRTWVANMNSVEGDLWLSNLYLASGLMQQSNNVLNAMPAKYHLTTVKQADIVDFKIISNSIAGQDPNNLSEVTLQTIQPIAFGADGWARSWARRLLTQHGWHFAPEYVKYGQGGEEREAVQGKAAFSGMLMVQPNPASDHVMFIMPNTAANAFLQIYDVNGRMMTTFSELQANNSLVWQTQDAASGIYYYHYFSTGQSISGKILLNK